MKIALPLFLCLTGIGTSSYAQLSDHLKKAEGKNEIHKARNIDFIYMINLDQRPEKFALASEQLHRYGIQPYRFSAVNGWELSLETINDVGLKYLPGMTPLFATAFPFEAEGSPSHEFMTQYGKTYFTWGMARGPIGIALSHLSVLKDAWDSGYETIWVMEDDIEVMQDPNQISDLIDKLDALVGGKNWDVLFTDIDYRGRDGNHLDAYGAPRRPDMDCSWEARYAPKYTARAEISSEFKEVTARFGAHSMIVRRSGMKKLLEFAYVHKIYLPFDLDNYLAPDIRRYGLTFDVVTEMLNAISDNGFPFYKEKEKTE